MYWLASNWSKRLNRFTSRCWAVGSEATDAFSQDFSEEEGFFHPTLDLKVMDKVEQCGTRVMATNLVQLLGIRMLEFESPVWMQSPTFRGRPGFGL